MVASQLVRPCVLLPAFVLMTFGINASNREPIDFLFTCTLCTEVQRPTVLPALYHSKEEPTLSDQCYA